MRFIRGGFQDNLVAYGSFKLVTSCIMHLLEFSQGISFKWDFCCPGPYIKACLVLFLMVCALLLLAVMLEQQDRTAVFGICLPKWECVFVLHEGIEPSDVSSSWQIESKRESSVAENRIENEMEECNADDDWESNWGKEMNYNWAEKMWERYQNEKKWERKWADTEYESEELRRRDDRR